ncbi:Membrane protein YidC 1 [Urinicoccus massiliensis]|uniref:Membrane protein YidC 1 n=1 Tax=Urinicoccus massiliensis TaxID=1723382 RepID=A0A8H2M6H7_9FIRM|nr:YidC/Oxa1 family membrane protein insertase [Urinicoccus massiliensis]KGF11067.1 membrane protein [Tissierellia bacterium S5-A11]VFB17402.1 Membrane protein YidC 1 [Urinicoccus massiliensis]
MISFIATILGKVLFYIYRLLETTIPQEPKLISYYALAVIVTTIIFKLALLPLNIAQTKNQRKMAELQPEVQKLQQKYKNDQQTLALKTQQLYKEANHNPLMGCLPLLIQFPIIISFFYIFRDPQKYAFTDPSMYQSMAKNFFYLTNLENIDRTMVLPFIAAGLTLATSLLMQKIQAKTNPQAKQMAEQQGMMKMMLYMGPVMILFAGQRLAGGIALYWSVSNAFTLIQQIVSYKSIDDAEEEALQEAKEKKENRKNK